MKTMKKLLLATTVALVGAQAQAAIVDCIIGVDTSATFGEASFGTLNPLALPGGPITTNFTYFGQCTRTSSLDPRRVQFSINIGAMSTHPGLTVNSNYSSLLLTLDWGSFETGTKQQTAVASFTLNGASATTTPGSRTFTQLTSTRARTCSNTNNNNCTAYGTPRDEVTYVYVNFLKACSISSAALNFGNIAPSSVAHRDAASNVSLACTNTTPYQVTLSGGASAPVGQRTMLRSPGPGSLNYQIFTNPARTSALVSPTSLAATGTGSGQSFPLYGRVFSGQFSRPGNYSDTLTMTVEY